jgi:hypothetical protein
LGASIGRTDEERAVAESVLRTANDCEMLKLMREQTTYLVLMVQVDNQKKREEWMAKQAEENNGEEGDNAQLHF